MIDAICTYGGNRKIYDIFSFQKLDDSDIEKYRQHLICPDSNCGAEAYFRRKSKDGKAACFGSRYHNQGCSEARSSKQHVREIEDAIEVAKVLADSSKVTFDFKVSMLHHPEAQNRKADLKSQNEGSKPQTDLAVVVKYPNLGMEKSLNSLMRGSDLNRSDTIILIDEKYPYKAKNLFVNFSDAEAADSPKDARPKMFWGTISHSDVDMEWLNPADCDDIGIPIKKYKKQIFERFNIEERRDVEGAGLILFGKCFWNHSRNRKIIEIWNADRIFISKDED